MRLSPRTLAVVDSPIGVAYDLIGESRATDPDGSKRPLLDLGQAAPPYPPAPEVVEHVSRVAHDPDGGTYTEVPGLPRLRAAVAAELSQDYRGRVAAEQVHITAGCNQAFCLVISALAGAGDEVILVLPYYFDHDMWLRLNAITPRYLEPAADLVPRAVDAEPLITDRTRAIVLVTPGNPSGVTVGPAQIADFAALARAHDIALVLDETYRSFRDTTEPAHGLFAEPDWAQHVVSLHSFSKDLALPGYRVGAVVASVELNREVAKLADCVAVCAPRIGQEAAWAGLTYSSVWRADRAGDLANRRRWFRAAMADRPGGFELVSCGGFFGWVRHPFADRPTTDVVADLATRYGVLVIPGVAFEPDDRRLLRFSVGPLDQAGAVELVGRLTEAGQEMTQSATSAAE